MPIVLIALAIVLPLIFIAFCLSEREYKIALMATPIPIALATWIVLAYGQIPETLSDEVFATQTIEHTDGSSITIMIIEGQVVNLTKEMGLFFPAGTKIRRVIMSKWTGGINWMNGKPSSKTTDHGWKKGLVSYSVVGDK